jgi:hypothetical protein
VCTYKVSTEDEVTIRFRNFGPKSIVMTVSAASASGGGAGVAEEEEEEELKIDEGCVAVAFPRPLSLGHLTEKLWLVRNFRPVCVCCPRVSVCVVCVCAHTCALIHHLDLNVVRADKHVVSAIYFYYYISIHTASMCPHCAGYAELILLVCVRIVQGMQSSYC